MKPVLCLRHEDPDHLGVAAEVLDAQGIPFHYLDVWKDHSPLPEPNEVSGVIVLGGSMNVDQIDAYPFLAPERAFIRRAVSEEVPFLGICLGGQLLARSFDAPVRRSPVRELGFVPIRPTEAAGSDPLLSLYREGDLVFQWHEDSFDLPAGAVHLMVGQDVPNQGFRLGRAAWGVQFHPEVTRDQLAGWIEMLDPVRVERAWGRAPEDILSEADRLLPAQQEQSRDLFHRFTRLLR